MILLRILLVLWIFILTAAELHPQNTNPEVTNVAFSISGTTVTVTYDVTDAEQDVFTIIMLVSSNGGSSWDYNYGTATGAIGAGVTEGTNKTIIWEYTGDYNPNFKIRIYANDETADGSNCGKVYYEGGPNSDGGGAYYNTIQIGTQCWLKENLDVGTRINGNQDQTNNSPTNYIEKYCYNDLDANCTTYGGLYQWNEAMKYIIIEGTQGICPSGWHIPTLAELQTISNVVNVDGNTLKALEQGSGAGVGTNTSGFSAFLAGYKYPNPDGYFQWFGSYTYFWSSTEGNATDAWRMRLEATKADIFWYCPYKTHGFSVRCLKN